MGHCRRSRCCTCPFFRDALVRAQVDLRKHAGFTGLLEAGRDGAPMLGTGAALFAECPVLLRREHGAVLCDVDLRGDLPRGDADAVRTGPECGEADQGL